MNKKQKRNQNLINHLEDVVIILKKQGHVHFVKNLELDYDINT